MGLIEAIILAGFGKSIGKGGGKGLTLLEGF